MILVNGDSWTKRAPAPEGTILWPDFLKESTNYDIQNIALPGSSNQRIYRTTLETLYTTTESISHLIIGWSTIGRAEIPTANGLYLALTPLGIVTPNMEDYKMHKDIKDQISKTFYSYCYNDDTATQNLLIMLLTIQDICKQRNIKLLNFFSFYNPFFQLNARFLNLYDKINLDSWIYPESTMQGVLKDFPFEYSKHVGTLGNQRWAEIVKEKL